jgi:hypothetical protein
VNEEIMSDLINEFETKSGTLLSSVRSSTSLEKLEINDRAF